MDPLVCNDLLEDVAQAAADCFEEKHLASASPDASADVRHTIVCLVTAAVLIYIEKAAPPGGDG